MEQFNFSSNSSYCLEEADCMEGGEVSLPPLVLILTAIIYSLIFCAGITGNTLVIYCVLRFPGLHTVTNTYILNLALADECFLLGETTAPPPIQLYLSPGNLRCSPAGGHDVAAGLDVWRLGLHPLHGLHRRQPDDELPLPDGSLSGPLPRCLPSHHLPQAILILNFFLF